MSMIRFLLRYECTVYPYVREYGGRTIYGEPETRKCRIEFGDYLTQSNLNGTEYGSVDQIIAKAKMFCLGSDIPPRSKVVFQDKEMIVISCHPCYGMNGVDHLEVMMQ